MENYTNRLLLCFVAINLHQCLLPAKSCSPGVTGVFRILISRFLLFGVFFKEEKLFSAIEFPFFLELVIATENCSCFTSWQLVLTFLVFSIFRSSSSTNVNFLFAGWLLQQRTKKWRLLERLSALLLITYCSYCQMINS